ncbi:MAG: hypothetical protein U9R17_19070, partial [Thermodesulfobacteriota bacterium]|nr:hypothetical protein [Thermodesulfobacteriota bacterium]
RDYITWVLVNAKPVFSDNELDKIIVNFVDITERKRAEEALKKRMTELEIFNDAAVGRELKIIEHRKEINELLKKLGKDEKYEIVE